MGLRVETSGEGRDVVCLHGMPSSPADFAPLVGRLPGCRVHVVFLPGYDGNDESPGEHGVTAVERALLEALSERNVRRPVLVGASMGGYRALSLTGRMPVEAVVSLGGFADLSAEERAGMREFGEALRAGADVRPAVPPRFLSRGHLARHPEDEARVRGWVDLVSPGALAEELEDVATAPSVLEVVRGFEGLIIARAGAEDQAIAPAHAEAIARAAPRGVLELVRDAGHALLLEDWEGCVRAVRRAVGLGT